MEQQEIYLRGHKNAAWALTTNAKEAHIISGSFDGTIKIWNPLLIENPLLKTYQISEKSQPKIYSILSINDMMLAVGSSDHDIQILSIDDLQFINSMKGHHGVVYSLAQLKEKFLISQSEDKTMKIWDLEAFKNVSTIRNTSNYVSTIATCNELVISEKEDQKIGIWNFETGKCIAELPGHTEGKDEMQRHMRTFSLLDDNLLATGANTFEIKLWDLRTRQAISTIKEHTNYVNMIVQLTESRACASVSGDRTIKFWDLRYNKSSIDTIVSNHSDWIQGLTTIKLKYNHEEFVVTGSGDSSIGIFPVKKKVLELKHEEKKNETKGSSEIIVEKIEEPQMSDLIENIPKYSNLSLQPIKTSYFYIEGFDKNKLKCNIFLNDINSTKITPFIELIEVMEPWNLKPKLEINYENSEVSIIFNKTLDDSTVKMFFDFVKKIHDSHIREIHENPDALWFYSNSDGNEILNFTNYPDELKLFLKDEKDLFNKLMKKKTHSLLIEVGCGCGENIDVAKSNNLDYIGLDFSANKIIKFKKELEKLQKSNNLGKIYKAIHKNVLDYLDPEFIQALPKNSKPIMVFPFNVFGNIAPISILIAKLRYFKLDFMISIYKNDDEVISMRKKYYLNCGYSSLDFESGKTGATFKSPEGLYSISYDKTYLQNLLKSFGYNVQIEESKYGLLFYGKL